MLTELENNIFQFAVWRDLQLESVSYETKTHIFKQWTTNKKSARKIHENTRQVSHWLQMNAVWYLNVCQGSTGKKRRGERTARLLQAFNSGAVRKSHISSDWCAKTQPGLAAVALPTGQNHFPCVLIIATQHLGSFQSRFQHGYKLPPIAAKQSKLTRYVYVEMSTLISYLTLL